MTTPSPSAGPIEVHIHIHTHAKTGNGKINRKLDIIMADLTGLQAAATQIKTDIDGAVAALDDLAAKVASGAAEQTDVDAIKDILTGASTKLDSAVATDDPSTAAPAPGA